MEFFKPMLCIGLTFITAVTVYAIENSENDSDEALLYDLKPVQYNIHLVSDFAKHDHVNFYGEYDANFQINTATYSIRLHRMDMKINETATRLISAVDGGTYSPTLYFYDNTLETVDLIFEEELVPGTYILRIKYSGTSVLNSRYSFSRISYTKDEQGKVWIATIPFMPLSVPGLDNLPCWGRPVLTQHFIISIKHPSTFQALSNMPIRYTRQVEDDNMWTGFGSKFLMSTCDVAIVLTDFVPVTNLTSQKLWCRSHLISQMQYAQSIIDKVSKLMLGFTDISRQISKIDNIAVQNFPLHGLSQRGLIFYNESEITYDPKEDSLFLRKKIAETITHEIIRQWFGILVSPTSKRFMWLFQGITLIYEIYILDKIYKDWRMEEFMVVDKLHESLNQDIDFEVKSIRSYRYPGETGVQPIMYRPTYNKSPILLRMLKHAVTDEVFHNGIKRYFITYMLESATSDDLWDAMQTALDKSDISHEYFKVKEVMDSWIRQNHYPVVRVNRNYFTGVTTISQEQFVQQADNVIESQWWVPVTWATKTNPDFSNTKPSRWLSPLNKTISFVTPACDWLIVNLQQTGYYRVKYDATNWKLIEDYLKSQDYKTIHVLNRAQIVDDIFVFTLRKQFEFSRFLEILSYLTQETDYIVWRVVFRHLERLSQYLPLPESQTFKEYMLYYMENHLTNLGYEEDPNESDIGKLKRIEFLKWACIIGSDICKSMATAKLIHHLTYTDAPEMSFVWRKWTYCSGLMTANRTIWNKAMNIFMDKYFMATENLFAYLACSEDFNIITDYLHFLTSNYSVRISEADRISALKFLIVRHSRNNSVLDYMLQNVEKITLESVYLRTMFEYIMFNVYSKEHVQKIKNVVGHNFRWMEGTFLNATKIRLAEINKLLNNFSLRFKKN